MIAIVFAMRTSLEDAAKFVSQVIGQTLMLHDSLYRGGDYFLFSSEELEVIVQRNWDLLDREVAEAEAERDETIIHVNAPSSVLAVESALLRSALVRVLRRDDALMR